MLTYSVWSLAEASIANKRNELPEIDGAPRPMAPPPETAGWVTVGGLDIQPARGAGTGAGVGWNGWI